MHSHISKSLKHFLCLSNMHMCLQSSDNKYIIWLFLEIAKLKKLARGEAANVFLIEILEYSRIQTAMFMVCTRNIFLKKM